jgi:hypothetical protein
MSDINIQTSIMEIVDTITPSLCSICNLFDSNARFVIKTSDGYTDIDQTSPMCISCAISHINISD